MVDAWRDDQSEWLGPSVALLGEQHEVPTLYREEPLPVRHHGGRKRAFGHEAADDGSTGTQPD